MYKKVDIIVVNWNSGNLTLQATAPYLNYSSDTIHCNVIVVDNASTDDSLFLFKGVVKDVIVNKKNLGFGKACNQAFEGSNADYILLLNPDAASQPAVLEGLVSFLEKNLAYGSVGPQQIGKDGNILKTCGRFPSFKTALFEILGLSKLFPKLFTPAPIMTDWDHKQSSDVDHVMGSYMLIRKSILDKIGFMDDEFFVYMEDMDLSKRIHNEGYKTFYNTSFAIFHEGGGTGYKQKANRLFYSLSAKNIYWRKYFNRFSYYLLTALSLIIEPFLRVVDSLIKEKKLNIKIIGKAYFRYIKKLLHR